MMLTLLLAFAFTLQQPLTTQNPLDQLRTQVKNVLAGAGVPFTAEQEGQITLMMEERRRASEDLFGDMMDFRSGPIQGQRMDSLVAGIRWMYSEFLTRFREYLTPEQLRVWEDYESRGGASALRRLLGTAGTPLTEDQQTRVQAIYMDLTPDAAPEAYAKIAGILTETQQRSLTEANKNSTVAQALHELTKPLRELVPVIAGAAVNRGQPAQQTQLIRIHNNGFTAENPYYSGSGGSGAEVIERGGGGTFHGNMSFEFKDESLNARNPFAHNRPPYQVRQTNGNFSGPLIKNRLSINMNVWHSLTEEPDTVHAITPAGLFDLGISRPIVNRDMGPRATWQLTDIHSITMGAFTGQWRAKNFGVGGFSLPERAFEILESWRGFNVRQFSAISARTLYETRFSTNRFSNKQWSKTQAVSINVLDSFNGGGAGVESYASGSNYDFGNLFTRMGSKLTLKTGFAGNYRTNRSDSKSNYLGSFTFSSLTDYLAGKPLTYRINRGNSLLDIDQTELAFFTQTDVKLTQRLTLMFGARYEWQTNFSDNNNLAPRLGFAYALGKSTVLRGGAGVFLQRLGIGLVQNQLRQAEDGSRQYELVVNNPSYPDPFLSGTVTVIPPSSVRVTDPDLAAPYNVLTSVSVEHTFPHNLFVNASYEFNRGIHGFRSRNLNAPLPGLLTRPDPARGNVMNLESTGLAESRIFRVSFRQRFSIFNANASYTFNSSYNDNDGPFSNPSNNYDLRSDWGRTTGSRHQINSTINARLPFGFFLTGTLSANDGNSYNITTGKDDNGDSVTNDRPKGMLRNMGNGPKYISANFNISKAVFFSSNGSQNGSATNMNVFANMTNAFNRTNYGTPSGVMTSSFFGKSFNARQAREIQVGLRFQF